MESKSTNEQRKKLCRFIAAYRNLPILWSMEKIKYSRNKRYEAYAKLLPTFREVMKGATLTDLKKKINSMRSNFRKELKKIEECNAMGVQYEPHTWTFAELEFLKGPSPDINITKAVSNGEVVNRSDVTKLENKKGKLSESIESDSVTEANENNIKGDFNELSSEEPTAVEPQLEEIPSTTYTQSFSHCDSGQRNSISPAPPVILKNRFDDMAKIWATKLNSLPTLQGIFAEKAINDVLFEAELGNLQRDSVQIHISPVVSLPSQMSRDCKFSHTEEFEGNTRRE